MSGIAHVSGDLDDLRSDSELYCCYRVLWKPDGKLLWANYRCPPGAECVAEGSYEAMQAVRRLMEVVT